MSDQPTSSGGGGGPVPTDGGGGGTLGTFGTGTAAGAGAGPGSGATLAALEAALRQPDAVLEPGVLGVLRRYVSEGGRPATVVELLSENYVGELGFMGGWVCACRKVEGCDQPPRVV
jgi:hypothetical protein